jgi:SAM-dependent methyltransferase
MKVPSEFGVEYDACRDVYERVFGDISCERSCKASLSDRDAMKAKKDYTLTYGELRGMEPLWKLLCRIDNEHAEEVRLHEVKRFYDLGSGSGRPVVAAALALSNLRDKYIIQNPTKPRVPLACVGIELLPGLYDLSVEAKEQWESLYIAPTNNISDSSIPTLPAELQFHLGSIFDLAVCDWTDGDVVFVNSTCFDVSMLLRVHEIAQGMKVGSLIVTLSRSMIEIGAIARNIKEKCASLVEQEPTWRLLFESREEMSW